MKYEEIYQKLKQQYTDEEIVDSMLIPVDMTEEELKAAHEEMRKIRLQRLRETTEEEQMLADVMRLRFQMENYRKEEGKQKKKK